MKHLNFNKEFQHYDNNAIVQKKVAEKLLSYIPKNKIYNKVLELGCGTGIFTKNFIKKIKFNELFLNDFFDTKLYFEKIKYRDFFVGDMSTLKLDNYDLIVSSSAFQWIDELEIFIKKLSLSSKNLAFSIYIKDNLKEINDHFGISLNYFSVEEIYNILKKFFKNVTFYEESYTLNFSTPLDALKHLKQTGVTGFSSPTSYKLIKSYSSKSLTYKVGYFYATNI